LQFVSSLKILNYLVHHPILLEHKDSHKIVVKTQTHTQVFRAIKVTSFQTLHNFLNLIIF